MTAPALPPRPLPALDDETGWFWTGGADGRLLLGFCEPCARWLHPAQTLCPHCLGELEHRPVSGRATVLTVTRNEQPWHPALRPPYIIAIVALAEDPAIRLTTGLVGEDAAALRPGSPVRVRFEQHRSVWLPLFEADNETGAAQAPVTLDPPMLPPMPAILQPRPEDRVVISGVGASAMGRSLARPQTALAVDAALAALADAGLERADIDGICCYPGSDGMPGLSRGGVRGLEQALGINPIWHSGANEVPGQIGAVMAAMLAVASGLCRHVLCVTSFAARNPPRALADADGHVAGEPAFSAPFGCFSPANWLALYAGAYCHRYQVDPEFLGLVVGASRAHAARNPLALQREPLTLEGYRASRMISTPLRLADCDMPCDGAKAVIVSARQTAPDLRRPAVHVLALGSRMAEPQSWDQGTITHQPQVFGAAAHMWSRTDLTPEDIDVAMLYDGFSFNLVSWLEALGFCAPGEAAAFIGDGSRIGPGGALPVNTDGGHLSAGRSNGWGHLIEAVQQLRGDAGARQIAGARTAVVTTGGAIPAGCCLLHRN